MSARLWFHAAIVLTAAVCAAPTVATSAMQTTMSSLKGTTTVIRKTGKGDNAGVVVWLKPIGVELPAPAPRPRLKLVQQNKKFAPHLLVVPVGSVVDFPNLDPFFHNAFSLFEGKRFDLGLYEGGTTRSVTFGNVGVCFIFCNIHPEMNAVVVVVDTPYYAISNAAGEWAIPNVPPGRYMTSVFHERNPLLNPREFPREVTVGGSPTDMGVIRFAESNQVIAPHTNKYGKEYTPAPGTGYIIIK